MKLDSKDKALVAVVIAAAALLVLVGVMWRRDVGRLSKELEETRASLVARRPAAQRDSTDKVQEAEYVPPAMRAPELAAFVDRARKASERIPVDITSRIQRVRHEEDIPTVVAILMNTEENDTVRNEAANLLQRSNYPRLVNDLIRVLANPEEGARFRAFCIQHLWRSAEKAGSRELDMIKAVFRNALHDRHVPVRREALLALVRMGDPKGKETAVRWLMDEEAEGVRDLAIRCVHDLDLRVHIPMIRKYARDPDTVIRIAAIVALSQWGDEESRPAFEEAARSDVMRLQRAGKAALERLDKAKAQ